MVDLSTKYDRDACNETARNPCVGPSHLYPPCTLANENRPIVQGGMQWVGVPSLAAAVSNAGGLGRSAMPGNALTQLMLPQAFSQH
jgi:Nitronate monooxygenase